MFVLLAHALITIMISLGSAHLFSRTWAEYIRRKRQEQWIDPSCRFEHSPLVFLSLVWGSITCGLLLSWAALLWHAAFFATRWPLAVPG